MVNKVLEGEEVGVLQQLHSAQGGRAQGGD